MRFFQSGKISGVLKIDAYMVRRSKIWSLHRSMHHFTSTLNRGEGLVKLVNFPSRKRVLRLLTPHKTSSNYIRLLTFTPPGLVVHIQKYTNVYKYKFQFQKFIIAKRDFESLKAKILKMVRARSARKIFAYTLSHEEKYDTSAYSDLGLKPIYTRLERYTPMKCGRVTTSQ